ncbi:hypothetical protein NDU88_008590 [Pleurodeles waltl]|uniref:Uncharacterized protein n=1 Tax=Pleurodeles waltl TaxID=8319 RepID=A0AAV7RV25_PLEWA|nr:hypothetical protein NDU88_008590 [Pleurodeles waltl]
MPGGRTSSKHPGKLSRQLLFSEALRHQTVPPTEEHSLTPCSSMANSTPGATMDRILQEISAVGRKLEGMDSAMASLTAETKSMLLDIAGFQTQVTGLEQRVTTVEARIASWVDRDQELLYLHSKLIDLEDRSRRDNVHFLRFPENVEGADIHSYLRESLPKLTGIIFDPPGTSKGAQARSQTTKRCQPSSPNHSMPASQCKDPSTIAGGQNARPILAGRPGG